MSQQLDPAESAEKGGKHHVYLHRRLDAAIGALAEAGGRLAEIKKANADRLTTSTEDLGYLLHAVISELHLAVAALNIPAVSRPRGEIG